MSFKRVVLENPGWEPNSLFFKLDSNHYSVLLESGKPHPVTARYSFLGLKPSKIFTAKRNQCALIQNHKSRTWKGNPLQFLEKEIKEWKVPLIFDDLPPLAGGMVGYFGYEALSWTEPVSLREKPGLDLPDIVFLFFDWVVCFDHFKNTIEILGEKEGVESGLEILRETENDLKKTENQERTTFEPLETHWESNFTKEAFCKAVDQAKSYIAAGDIFQANIAQRLSCRTEQTGRDLYRALNRINPSPFSGYLKTPGLEIISCSPERLVRREKNLAETRPIAGTRPKVTDPERDSQLEKELAANKKERAEHIMLLDLERNDLGKVCEYGSVRVSEFLGIESYSHVRHLVSNVTGTLKKSSGSIDLFKAMFPGGTITGTPKVRSMEIIDELETVKRDIYTGSLGYFSYTGACDFNILIRTLIKKENQVYLHAGAGIVADSQPEKEYEETLHKANALIQAISAIKNAELTRQN